MLAEAEVRLDAVEVSSASTIGLYERFELTVQVSGEIENPYDPDEVRLEATFAPAKGEPVTVSGFYYQPFERITEAGHDVIQPAGEPVWKVRFTPRQVGRWSYAVRLVTPHGAHSVDGEPLLVVASDRAGFVQLNRDEGNFQFENGEPFIPIGENLAWGPSLQPLPAFDRWFRDLSRQRANYIRVWMAPWMLRLETKTTGAGRYDQLRAWQLDYLLEQSAPAGIFWQLVLLNHGSFSQTQDAGWHNNPYNELLGGMCHLPNDFLTDPEAKAMFTRLMRYMVSRWGYSPQLAVWELFNEADFGDFETPDLILWTEEMSTALRAMDVNRRPITTSFHWGGPDAIWALPNIDLVQLHIYDRRDIPAVFGGPVVAEPKQKFQKPVFIGEFGWIGETMRQFDDIGIHLHEGLWSSLMGGAAGSALIWFWDEYVHPNGLERHFGALEAFWRGEQLGRSLGPMELSLSDAGLTGLGLGNADRGYLWIKNRAHTLNRYIVYRTADAKRRLRLARGQETPPVTYAPESVRGATVTIRGLRRIARYRVEWWDTYRGRITARSVLWSEWGTVTLDVPTVQFDVAAKLIKLRWWERG